ncbi:MAG: baseplate J/gp47 family protein [bacterium]
MALPTFSQIVQSMITFLQGSRPDIATQPGSVVNDVVISTVANQLSAQNGTDSSVYSSIQYIQNLQAFVNNAATILPADLDAIGNNYGLTRLPGTQATGTLTIRIRNYTTSSPIITVPSGTVVSTLSTSSSPAVSFSTTATVTFTPSLAPFYFNPVSGFYEQTAPIVCQTIGTVGNVAANTITSLIGSGLGVDAVTNTTATFGGSNIESNVVFASRIQIKLEGNNIGTANGIISLVDTNPNVTQSIIVGPNDPAMIRNQYGGSVNVYIRGQVLVTTPETFTYTTTGSQQYVLLNQPAISVGSVTGIVGGLPYTFVPGTDYAFVLNPNALFAGSVDAASYINFNVTTSFSIITVGLPFTVTTVTDAIHLVVNSTTGMTAGDSINQGSHFTTITTVTDLTHLVVGSTSGWVGGGTAAVDTSVKQFIVNTTTGMSIGDTINQGSFSTTITNVVNSTTVDVASTSGFGAGVATFSGFKPDNNTVVTITYTYDSLIPTLQALLNNNSNHIVASDILVVEAIQALINFNAGIVIVPGYVPNTVVTNVVTTLSNYLNNLGLGAVVILSELVSVMQGVAGVAEVDLASLILQSTENGVITTIPPGQQISVGKQAYTVANSLVITVES